MTRKPTVWLVDDLPDNLTKFQKNHSEHFHIELFTDPSAVLRRINNKEYPDALLCDVFFYDTPDEALCVERKADELAEQLRRTARDIHVQAFYTGATKRGSRYLIGMSS
jgi:CheY-like chemotaxis protein